MYMRVYVCVCVCVYIYIRCDEDYRNQFFKFEILELNKFSSNEDVWMCEQIL